VVPFRVDGELSCVDHIASDDRLLREGHPLVRVVVLSDRAASFGVGMPSESPRLERARDRGFAVVRRSTGGTTVFHEPGDLAWSIVLPRSHARVGADFTRAYGRLGAGILRFLEELGIAAGWVDPPGISEDYCLLSSRGQVVAVGPKVVGGAAQHLTASALLHHGVLAWTVETDEIGRVFEIPVEVVRSRLSGLSDFGVEGPPERLATSLARRISESLESPRPEG